eukprot:1159936-Pelagomonas_calceolata.AAC.3
MRTRLISSRPDAILITPYKANPLLLLFLPPAHTMRYAAGMTLHRGPAYPTGKALTSKSGPGQQLEAAQRQHADLCNNISGEAVMLHTVLLGVGGTCYTKHTLNKFKHLGLDHQSANKFAHKLNAHSVVYANKLVTTRRAIENKI